MDKLSLCAEARDYLMKFCAERNQGRSGKLLWDSFIIYAHKSQTSPPAVDLYTWLQEHLDDHSGAMGTNIEALIEDYQRIVSLLSAWEQVTIGSKFKIQKPRASKARTAAVHGKTSISGRIASRQPCATGSFARELIHIVLVATKYEAEKSPHSVAWTAEHRQDRTNVPNGDTRHSGERSRGSRC